MRWCALVCVATTAARMNSAGVRDRDRARVRVRVRVVRPHQ